MGGVLWTKIKACLLYTSRNERMFLLTFTVVNLAPTRQRLENDVFTVGGIAQKYNLSLIHI